MRPSLDPAYVARQIMAQASSRNALPSQPSPIQPMGEKEGATQTAGNNVPIASSSPPQAEKDFSLRPPAPPPLPQQAQDQQPHAFSNQERPAESRASNNSNQLPLPGLAAALSSSSVPPRIVPSSENQRQPLPSLPGSAAHQMLPPPSSFTPSSSGAFSHTAGRGFERPLAPLVGNGGHRGPETAEGSHFFSHAHNALHHSSFAAPPAYNLHNTTGATQGNFPPALHSGTTHYGISPPQGQYGSFGSAVTEAAQYHDYDQQDDEHDDEQDDEEDEDIDMIDDTGDDPLLARQNDLSTFENSVRTFVGANEKNLISEFGDKPVRQRKSVKRGPRKPAEPTGDVKLRLSAATNAFMSGDLDEALRQVNDAIRINGEIHRSWSLLAEILRERGDYKQSLLALVCAAHLQPKIFDVWLDCGRFALELSEEVPEDADDTLRIAIMSLSQAVKIQPDNVGVRQLRAALYLTRESFKLAASEYKWIVERSPHDVDALRGLADASVQLAESSRRQAEGQREAARDAYQSCIEHFQSEYPTGLANTQLPFTWDDAFACVALLIHLEQYEDALRAARSLARWLLGRKEDDYWDQQPDDREWDIGDERRLDTPEFDLEKFPPESYGRGLPLRLRISLAICRLRLDRDSDEEAMQHLEFLDPADVSSSDEDAQDSGLFLEVASHLYETERLTKALPFYEPLRRQEDLLDATALYRAGKCYLEIGDKRQAEECFTAALDSEETPLDTRINTRFELAKMYEAARKNTEALYLLEEAMGIERERNQGVAESAGQQDQERSRPKAPRKLAPKTGGETAARARKPTGPRKRREPGAKSKNRVSRPRPLLFALDEDRRLEEERRSAYIAEKWRTVREERQDSEEGPGEAWMDAARELIDDFRSYKGFYPWDRYLMQMGLRKDDTKPSSTNPHLLKMAQRLRDEVDAQQSAASSKKVLETPVSYRNVEFPEWLTIFLEFALTLAHLGRIKEAYDVCEAAMAANVFFENPEDKFLINIATAACAVRARDEERCVEVARSLMANYPFSSDAFRMYVALGRLCHSTGAWYADHRVQKFLLRQIKMMDVALLPEESRSRALEIFDTKSYPGREMDVQLLMLYGHILFISNSFTFALNYFVRAYALDPDNLMINLSIGQAYLHHALKRQSENRQHSIAQGFAFLHRYYDARLASPTATPISRQEAHYNMARSYHAVGLIHLAVQYYRRVFLEIEGEGRGGISEDGVTVDLADEDLAREAAYNLQQCCLIGGDLESMRDIAERWLVL